MPWTSKQFHHPNNISQVIKINSLLDPDIVLCSQTSLNCVFLTLIWQTKVILPSEAMDIQHNTVAYSHNVYTSLATVTAGYLTIQRECFYSNLMSPATIKKVLRSSGKVTDVFASFTICWQIFHVKSLISNFTKIHRMGAALKRAQRQMAGHTDVTKLTYASCNYVNVP
jgi:hypothetical protein